MSKLNFIPLSSEPSFRQFLQQWLTKNSLLPLGVYLPLAGFGLLAMQIWRLEGGLAWDVAILNAIHSTAGPRLDQIAQGLTPLGTKWGVFPATLLVAAKLLYDQRWRPLTYWLLALLGGGLLNRFTKLWLHRLRPSLWDHVQPSDFSFPSGHAMSSMVFVAALLLLSPQSERRWVGLVGGLFVVAIGWTRLYLGVHYPSDILAGWMLAVAWVASVSQGVSPSLAVTPVPEPPPGAESGRSEGSSPSST